MQIQENVKNYIVENILFGNDEGLGNDILLQENGILDSMGFLEIITFVEEQFQIKVEDDEVIPENFDSIQRISNFIDKKLKKKVIV
ncbi:MAG: acyl carrier protein [Bacteroidales bacterium]|nr:acyl carrier protein [Bacteroidales bacterium]